MNKPNRVTEDGVRQGSTLGASKERESQAEHMMKPYTEPEISHDGKHARRLSTNPREHVFAEAWKAQQTTGHTLEWLLCASLDQNTQDREITQAEATCAATLMQWLGSPVGYCWLEDTLRKANDAERRTPASAEEAGRTEYERVTRNPKEGK